MVDNDNLSLQEHERDITALELHNIMVRFAIEIDESEIIAFVSLRLLKKFFPLLVANMPEDENEFETLAARMATTIRERDIAEFANSLIDIFGSKCSLQLGHILCHLLFDNDSNSHINNKEVN